MALLTLLLGGALACQSRPPEAANPPADLSAPTLEELERATYTGVEEAAGPFTLSRGRWEGQPFEEGAASAPSVTLVRGFRLAGDLDGDGREEAVVLLAAGTGGTGEMSYLAVVGRDGAKIRNVATAPVGDRVQLRQGRIEGRRIVLDVVQAGEKDARCCPGDLVTRSWTRSRDGLEEGAAVTTGRLSLDALAGTEWVLRAWASDEPAPATPSATLRIDGDRLAGNAGCNDYFATAKAGDVPGDLEVGPIAGTRKMCPQPETDVETRFMQQLESVRQARFVAGQLALVYSKDDAFGVMLFERRAAP